MTSEVRSKSIICFSCCLVMLEILTQALNTRPAFVTMRLLVRLMRCGSCLMIGVIFDQSSDENSSERWRQTRDDISSSSSSSLVDKILTTGLMMFELKMYERFWRLNKNLQRIFGCTSESGIEILPCLTRRLYCLTWTRRSKRNILRGRRGIQLEWVPHQQQ